MKEYMKNSYLYTSEQIINLEYVGTFKMRVLKIILMIDRSFEMNKQKLALRLIQLAFVLWLLSFLWVKFDVTFTHFEDGSGSFVYCLPFSEPWFGGCN